MKVGVRRVRPALLWRDFRKAEAEAGVRHGPLLLVQGARELGWHPRATAWVVGVRESKGEGAEWQRRGNNAIDDEVERETGRARLVGSGQGMGDDDDDWTLWDGDSATHVISRSRRGFKQPAGIRKILLLHQCITTPGTLSPLKAKAKRGSSC